MGATEDSRALMWRITDEIWNGGRTELIDELIAEDLVDHVDLPGLEGSGRARYRASIEMTRAAFPDYRNPLDFVLADVSLRRVVWTLDRHTSGRVHGYTPDRSILRRADVRHPAVRKRSGGRTMGYVRQSRGAATTRPDGLDPSAPSVPIAIVVIGQLVVLWVVVFVDPRLPCVEVRRWNPFAAPPPSTISLG